MTGKSGLSAHVRPILASNVSLHARYDSVRDLRTPGTDCRVSVRPAVGSPCVSVPVVVRRVRPADYITARTQTGRLPLLQPN